MKKHLRVSTYWNDEHPQKMLKRLGITYKLAVPQTISDQWWFFSCDNVPEELPEEIEILDLEPEKLVGYGLSKEDVELIENDN